MSSFSVVIPTYNRASKLSLAVQSVLNQSYEDFELVISNGGSTDETKDVVLSFKDPRINYVESMSRISAAQNYQQGLESARGKFITFLSDDDAYTPMLLERVSDVLSDTDAEVVGYEYCRYYHEDLYDFEIAIPANSLLINDFDKSVTHFSSAKALDQVFAIQGLSSTEVDPRFICPYLSNATYSRRVFDKIKGRRANLFDQVPADIYLAAAVFFEVQDYFCLDEPLLVWSNWEGNATASAQRSGDRLREHYLKLLNGRTLDHTPLKFPTQLNCAANAVLEAASDFDSAHLNIDWTTYFVKTYENLTYLRGVGVDTSLEELEFEEALWNQPPSVQSEVRSRLSDPIFTTKSFLNERFPRFAAKLRRVLGRKEKLNIISGVDTGFANVLEASRHTH